MRVFVLVHKCRLGALVCDAVALVEQLQSVERYLDVVVFFYLH